MEKRIIDVQTVVRGVLERNEDSRCDDHVLYYLVCRVYNPSVERYGFHYVMRNRDYLGIPGFETVRRTRQKLQSKFPSLRADDNTIAARELKEEDYREYARQ